METNHTHADSGLLQALSKGDERAYHLLYSDWNKRIYTYIYAITAQKTLAEEGTQEIFITIWRNRHKLPAIRNFEAWLFVLVRRHTLNLLERVAREKKVLDHFSQLMASRSTGSLDNLVEHAEQRKLLEMAIRQLPAQQRAVYELSQLQGLSRNEIAEKLQLSPNTVRNHLSAAILSLRTCLQHHYNDSVLLLFIYHLLK